MSCPDCGALAPGGAKLCPACGFPLVLQSRGQEGTAPPLDLLRKPGEAAAPVAEPPAARVATTSRLPVAAPPPAAGLDCRSCGHVSAPARVRCERCGAPLRAVELPFVAAAPVPPAPPRRRRWWPLTAAAAAVLLAGGGAAWFLTRDTDPPPAAGETVTGDSPAPSAAPVRIPAAAVSGKASSTKKPLRAYGIGNSLDGKRGTSWNSDGNRDGTGKGTVLTYTFDRPRHVVRITLINGYAESRRLKDVWESNGRMKRVVVSSDAGSRDLTLADTVKPQTVTADLGVTRSIRIEVRSVVEGTRFPDLALTDIVFDELP